MHATPQPLDSTPLPARDRRRLFIRAIAVGFAAGLLSIAFRYSLQAADDLRKALLEQGPLVAISFAILSISLGVFLVHRFAPEAAGSGIPHVEGVLHLGLPFRWIRVIVVKAAGGVLAIGGGLTLGREGPTVQLGAATGAGIGWFGRASGEERRSLIAIGAGAGLSATFNAPLAGMRSSSRNSVAATAPAITSRPCSPARFRIPSHVPPSARGPSSVPFAFSNLRSPISRSR